MVANPLPFATRKRYLPPLRYSLHGGLPQTPRAQFRNETVKRPLRSKVVAYWREGTVANEPRSGTDRCREWAKGDLNPHEPKLTGT